MHFYVLLLNVRCFSNMTRHVKSKIPRLRGQFISLNLVNLTQPLGPTLFAIRFRNNRFSITIVQPS